MMTPERVVRILDEQRTILIEIREGYTDKDNPTYDEYTEQICAYDTAIAAMQKLVPVKVKANKVWNSFVCPACGMYHSDDTYEVTTLSFCPHCNQALDIEWEDSK